MTSKSKAGYYKNKSLFRASAIFGLGGEDMSESNKTMAVILAGGRGTRMDVLCNGRAKPLLPFAGRFRIIDFTLSNCAHSGIGNIAVLVDYERRTLADYLADGFPWMAQQPGVFSILDPGMKSYKGTADAVFQNLDFLDRQSSDLVLILAADHVYKMDYRKMVDFHRKEEAEVTVGVINVPIEEASRFGTVIVGPGGRILDFEEKPQVPRSNLVSMGIYIFSKGLLMASLREDALELSSPHDFGHAVLPRLVKEHKVFAYKFYDYWQDIGTVEAYYRSNIELTRDFPSISMNTKWSVLTKDVKLSPSGISSRSFTRNSLISPGCVVRGAVENSVLSPGVRVEENAVVRNSVIMENASIGEHSIVDRSILDEGVNIGKNCYVGFGNRLIDGDRDITVLGRGVDVPPHTAIGRKCKVLPDLGPVDFTSSIIHPGTVLSRRQ